MMKTFKFILILLGSVIITCATLKMWLNSDREFIFDRIAGVLGVILVGGTYIMLIGVVIYYSTEHIAKKIKNKTIKWEDINESK